MAFVGAPSLEFDSYKQRRVIGEMSRAPQRSQVRSNPSSNTFSVLANCSASNESLEARADTTSEKRVRTQVPPPFVKRSWVIADDVKTPSPCPVSEVTVMTYNILAQNYISSKIFPASPRPVLRAPFRRKAVPADISAHVTAHNVDIICLQELEVDEIPRILEMLPGFDGSAYKQRTRTGTRQKKDGCGIFWRRERFESVEDVNANHVEFNDIANDPVLVKVVDEKQLAIRECVGALVCLSERDTGMRVVVGSAHIFWDPEFENLKLAQTHWFLRAAIKFAKRTGSRNVVLAGDWNSMPESPVFEMMNRGQVDVGVAECSLGLPAEVLLTVNKPMDREFRMWSALPYDVDAPPAAENDAAPLTTLTWKFRGALDHIFVSSGDGNRLAGNLSLPCAKDFEAAHVSSLPCEAHPSDHLPVIVSLALGHGHQGGSLVPNLEEGGESASSDLRCSVA